MHDRMTGWKLHRGLGPCTMHQIDRLYDLRSRRDADRAQMPMVFSIFALVIWRASRAGDMTTTVRCASYSAAHR
jgi:hypothetical protein